ncbi:class I SAM-dependent methyltransferase [Bacteroides caecimuris]|uniref:class I SAM-dependent methyltransferase n=1 Tax=Bacteroides caecimuris TaxID=1796613 RepID=UPI002658854D|nr:class I SAM-dependent methyltransferase [Bacteroides caecimuris]
MNLFPDLQKRYTKEQMNARDAQRLAEFIAFGPVIFQTARIMLKWGILDLLRDSSEGLTIEEVAKVMNISEYASKCLLEASLSIGIVLVNPETNKFTISKTGWFLINDTATRINIDFNHDVNYRGWFNLDEALKNGKPEGLKTLGDWPTVYEGLSSLPKQIQDSWFGFDHFYSDNSFDQALEIVFSHHPKTLLDVGGNTGRWAMRCVDFDKEIKVTILDLPQQIGLMKKNIAGEKGAERIDGLGVNLLDSKSEMPSDKTYDAVWMSQFLDCFSEEQIVDILRKAAKVMNPNSRLFVMETLWDRQRFETASMCLTLTSLYFTAIANGNSKMYHSEDMKRLIKKAGLEIETIHDYLGQGHSIIVCKLKN